MRLKGKFYRSVARPNYVLYIYIYIYGSECWVVDKRIVQSTSVAEMECVVGALSVQTDEWSDEKSQKKNVIKMSTFPNLNIEL